MSLEIISIRIVKPPASYTVFYLGELLQFGGFIFLYFCTCQEAYGFSVPQSDPQQWECRDLTIGLLGNSLVCFVFGYVKHLEFPSKK